MKKTGAVLAAVGLSSRMGDFKPPLPFGDTTIAFRATSMFRRLGVDPVLVVIGYRAEELEDHLKGTGACFVGNTKYRHTRMFDSVKLGIQVALEGREWVLVMSMDLPTITDDIIKQVMEAPGQIVRAVHDGEPGRPVCMEGEIARRICTYTGDQGLKGAIEASGVLVEDLEVGNESIYLDVDTREEYRELPRWACRQESGQRKCRMH